MKEQAKGAHLNDIAFSDLTSVLNFAAVDPGAVPALQVFQHEPFAFTQDEAMVSRDHPVYQTQVALLMPPHQGLLPRKGLFNFLPVRSDYGEVKHGDAGNSWARHGRFIGEPCVIMKCIELAATAPLSLTFKERDHQSGNGSLLCSLGGIAYRLSQRSVRTDYPRLCDAINPA